MSTIHDVQPQTAGQTPPVPLTLEGYSVLHQMMRVRRTEWRKLPQSEQVAIVTEAEAALDGMEKRTEGPSALFSMLGHKADLLFVHFRNSFAELNQAELALAGLRLSEYLEITTSYVSIIELGLYESTAKIYKALQDQGLEPFTPEWNAGIQENMARQREAIVPLRRIGMPDDVARTVAFLIDPKNRYITGENIMVDGGLTLSVLDRIPGVARRKGDASPTEAASG